ncbi:MAG TPA: ribose-5-phosphate isomerase RpiA [Pyrinomonadaceae bacterium]|jgi:ribose 5-phosphate isomerase A
MNLKQAAGERAAEFVHNGMTIGLGTGSTVYWTILRLGFLVGQGLKIRAVPTSRQTEDLAKEQDIPLVAFDRVEELDLTIDGADEISPSLDLIKGGGGALLREKLVAAASKRLIIVADRTKLVESLGAFLLPVEIVPFAWETTRKRIEKLGFKTNLRMKEGEIFVTDNHNYILDCDYGKIENPAKLHCDLKALTGVIETGFFIGMTDFAVVADEYSVEVVEKPQK